jgi:protein-tyrosine-phosphatase
MTLETLERLGYETEGLRSKSWNEFTGPESPRIDFILTVCGNALKESGSEACPVWPGHPASAHWGVEDPAAFEGSVDDERAFFERIHNELAGKVAELVALDPAELGPEEFLRALDRIGEL